MKSAWKVNKIWDSDAFALIIFILACHFKWKQNRKSSIFTIKEQNYQTKTNKPYQFYLQTLRTVLHKVLANTEGMVIFAYSLTQKCAHMMRLFPIANWDSPVRKTGNSGDFLNPEPKLWTVFFMTLLTMYMKILGSILELMTDIWQEVTDLSVTDLKFLILFTGIHYYTPPQIFRLCHMPVKYFSLVVTVLDSNSQQSHLQFI